MLFFVQFENGHGVGTSFGSLASACGERLLPPLCLLSESNPLCWASIRGRLRRLLFLVQFENRHKSFRRQLNGTQGTHFLLAFLLLSSSFFLRVMSPP